MQLLCRHQRRQPARRVVAGGASWRSGWGAAAAAAADAGLGQASWPAGSSGQRVHGGFVAADAVEIAVRPFGQSHLSVPGIYRRRRRRRRRRPGREQRTVLDWGWDENGEKWGASWARRVDTRPARSSLTHSGRPQQRLEMGTSKKTSTRLAEWC